MATKTRTPGGTDFLAGPWVPAGAPSAGDDVQQLAGSESFTSNTDVSGTNLLSVFFGPGYGSVSAIAGTSTNPLKFRCDQTGNGLLRFAGSAAQFNLRSGGATTKIDRVWLFPRTLTTAITIGSVLIGGELVIDAGSVSADANTDLPGTLYVGGGSAVIERRASAPVGTVVVAGGGRLTMRRTWTTMKVGAGATVEIELQDGDTGGTIENLGGTVVHRSGDTGAQTHYAGTYDAGGLLRNATVAACTFYSAARYVAPALGCTISFTSGPTEKGKGPKRS